MRGNGNPPEERTAIPGETVLSPFLSTIKRHGHLKDPSIQSWPICMIDRVLRICILVHTL